jgi:hypothetical protein
MASKAVVDAVESRLGATWTVVSTIDATSTDIPVIGVNTLGTPPADGSSFIEVQYPVANEIHVGMAAVGNRTFRESGAFRLILSIPRGQGIAQGLDWADQLRVLFRAKQFSGVSCLAPNPAFIDNSNDTGNYFVLSIVVPYYFYLFA